MKFLTLLGIFLTTPVFADQFQILHTNDLHAQLEHATHRPDVGGYARLKTLLVEQKAEARKKGIGVISMDAGDFMEGSIFYLADKGKKAFEAFDELGHDVAILGNHDYLMAPDDLEAIFRDTPPHRPLLAANFQVDKSYKYINEYVKPVWEGKVGNVKVGVIGLTTNDFLYKWRLGDDGKISGEVKVAKKWAKYLRERGNEVIIALTHIGVKKDQNLAKEVPEIDVIVGGHSHTMLTEVVFQKTGKNKIVPIVQAGHHGEWLGKLNLDYDRATKKVKVLTYNLLPVNGDAKDPHMEHLVSEANEHLNAEYGEAWLNEVVGHSTLRPKHEVDNSKIWHYFIADSMKETTGADFAISVAPMSGHNYPVGNVTRRALYEGNPRSFDYSDKYGYNIYTARIMGGWIKILAPILMKFNVPLYFSGVEFTYSQNADGGIQIWDVTHQGKKINPFKYYKVAFSEGIVRGAYNISQLTRFIVHQGEKKNIPMWEAMEKKFRKDRTLTENYLSGRLPASGGKPERMMVPAAE